MCTTFCNIKQAIISNILKQFPFFNGDGQWAANSVSVQAVIWMKVSHEKILRRILSILRSENI